MSKGRDRQGHRNMNWLVLALAYGVAIVMVVLVFAYTILRVPPGNESQQLVLLVSFFFIVLALFFIVWGPLGAKDLIKLGEWYRKRRKKS